MSFSANFFTTELVWLAGIEAHGMRMRCRARSSNPEGAAGRKSLFFDELGHPFQGFFPIVHDDFQLSELGGCQDGFVELKFGLDLLKLTFGPEQ